MIRMQFLEVNFSIRELSKKVWWKTMHQKNTSLFPSLRNVANGVRSKGENKNLPQVIGWFAWKATG